jgi:hypothetical protein
MRWRFVDKVDSLTPWREACGRKAVTLEEYSLLLPLGREGEFPENLCLESCVALARWLVAASSGFATTCILSEVQEFVFTERVSMGDVLDLRLAVAQRDEKGLAADCDVRRGVTPVARGRIAVSFLPLAGLYDVELLAGTWREIYAST